MKRSQPLRSDPAKQTAWRRRSAQRYEDRLREEHGCPFRPIRAVNPERRAKESARAYGPPARREWMKRQPSVATGRGPCVNAHVPDPSGPSGTGRKADARWIVPLTWEEHEELHAIGVESFEAKYGIGLQAEARRTEAAWQEHQREGE